MRIPARHFLSPLAIALAVACDAAGVLPSRVAAPGQLTLSRSLDRIEALPLGFGPGLSMNDHGDVVGFGSVDGESHAFVRLNGTVIDIGRACLPAGHDRLINERGDVLVRDCMFNWNLWRDGVLTALGSLGGGATEAHAINRAGDVVGWSKNAAGLPRAFLWRDGSMGDLGTPAGLSSEAVDINDRGDVIGTIRTASGQTRAFLHSGGVMKDIGLTGAASSRPIDINEVGDVAGLSSTAGVARGFAYRSGVISELPSLGYPRILVAAINNRGDIAGAVAADPGPQGFAPYRPVIWRRDGDAVELTIPSPGGSRPITLNDRGDVLLDGRVVPGGQAGMIWRDGVTTVLPTFGPPGSIALDMNAHGEATGVANGAAPGGVIWTTRKR